MRSDTSAVDDAFRLTAARMLRTRWPSPFAMRATATGALITVLTLSFGTFVAGQQRASDERRAVAIASQAADAVADGHALDAAPSEMHASRSVVEAMVDTRAQTTARSAAEAARELIGTASMEAADAAGLTGLGQDVLFVDGPSSGPSVVSVFAGSTAWSAAVLGSARTCYWVALSMDGETRYGTGPSCTGLAALAADRTTW
jgi:hypothetical protein